MTPEERLKAAQMHEYAGVDLPVITEEGTWYGRVLICDGFYLCVSKTGVTWQSRSRWMKTPHDLTICQHLLARAREIMAGGA